VTIVTIKEGFVMTEGVKKLTVHFDFCWKRASRLKILWAPRLHYTRSFDWN